MTGRSGASRQWMLTAAAVLAVVAWLLSPVLARRAAQRSRTECLCRLKMLATVCMAYAVDYANHYPVGLAVAGSEFDASDGSVPEDWASALLPYAGRPDLFACPLADRPGPSPGVSYVLSSGTLAHSDEASGILASWPLTVRGYPADGGRALRDYLNASRSILLYERDAAMPCGAHGAEVVGNLPGRPGSGIRPLHGEGANYAFIDGHCEPWAVGAGRDWLNHGCRPPK
jgi:prepilin-type processing-associated H-X9-DG protein